MDDEPENNPPLYDQDKHDFWDKDHRHVHIKYRHYQHFILLMILGLIAIIGLIAGTVLATAEYSSAGAFSIASACVGALSALVISDRRDGGPNV